MQIAAEKWTLLGPIISFKNPFSKIKSCSVGPSVWDPIQNYKVSVDITRFKSAHISDTNGRKELIFGEWTLFMMLFPNILSHSIFLQIHPFVTSHLTTLKWLGVQAIYASFNPPR